MPKPWEYTFPEIGSIHPTRGKLLSITLENDRLELMYENDPGSPTARMYEKIKEMQRLIEQLLEEHG